MAKKDSSATKSGGSLEKVWKLEKLFAYMVPNRMKLGKVQAEITQEMKQIEEDFNAGKFDVDSALIVEETIMYILSTRAALGYKPEQAMKVVDKKLAVIREGLKQIAKEGGA